MTRPSCPRPHGVVAMAASPEGCSRPVWSARGLDGVEGAALVAQSRRQIRGLYSTQAKTSGSGALAEQNRVTAIRANRVIVVMPSGRGKDVEA